MGEIYVEMPEYLVEWIKKQHMFWVASAPLSPNGHINISPKGVANTFHISSPTQVWYEDLSGSGAETIAHIRENGRITILFHAFEGPPRIARLYGMGSYHEFGTAEYNRLLPPGTRQPGSRAAIVIDIWKVGTTCGYAVPYYTFVGHRIRLLDWAAKKEKIDFESSISTVQSESGRISQLSETAGISSKALRIPGTTIHPNGLVAWWQDRNLYSLDGLPALSLAFQTTFGAGSHAPVPKGLSYSAQHQSSLPTKPNSGLDDIRVTSDFQAMTGQQTVLQGLVSASFRWITATVGPSFSFNNTTDHCLSVHTSGLPTCDISSDLIVQGPPDELSSDLDKSSLLGVSVTVSPSMGHRESPEALSWGLGPPAWTQGMVAIHGVKISLLGYVLAFLLGVIFTSFFKELHRPICTLVAD